MHISFKTCVRLHAEDSLFMSHIFVVVVVVIFSKHDSPWSGVSGAAHVV